MIVSFREIFKSGLTGLQFTLCFALCSGFVRSIFDADSQFNYTKLLFFFYVGVFNPCFSTKLNWISYRRFIVIRHVSGKFILTIRITNPTFYKPSISSEPFYVFCTATSWICMHHKIAMSTCLWCALRRSIENCRGSHKRISGHANSIANEAKRNRFDIETSSAIAQWTASNDDVIFVSFVDAKLCRRARAVILQTKHLLAQISCLRWFCFCFDLHDYPHAEHMFSFIDLDLSWIERGRVEHRHEIFRPREMNYIVC